MPLWVSIGLLAQLRCAKHACSASRHGRACGCSSLRVRARAVQQTSHMFLPGVTVVCACACACGLQDAKLWLNGCALGSNRGDGAHASSGRCRLEATECTLEGNDGSGVHLIGVRPPSLPPCSPQERHAARACMHAWQRSPGGPAAPRSPACAGSTNQAGRCTERESERD